MATRWINKGPTAEGTGNAHGFSANDDGVIIHHNGEMFGVINSDKIWGVNASGNFNVPLYASGANFIANNASPIAFKLPPTKLGIKFTFVATLGTGHTLAPVAVDRIWSKVDNTPWTSAAVGDSITVVGDGVHGWLVTAVKGWA